ncbi:MAG: hypothetical protein SF051_12665 [Elusimicrobiota bacterium]|nr:hypothetical protein [Elusimicrobiota bacterium]
MSARPGSHERLKAAIAAGLIGYLVVGMAHLGPDDRERTHLFPVFAWNMFSFVPPRGPFVVLLTQDRGKPLTPPLPIEDAVGLRWPEKRDDAAHMANTLVEALVVGEGPRIEASRKAIESRLLTPPCAYEAYEERRRVGAFTCLPEEE